MGGGWSGYLGDWELSGDLLDDVGMTGTMWGQQGRWEQHGWGQRGRRGPHGDLLGAMGMMWGQRE